MSADTVSLPFASIQNESLRVDYLTSLGPRIIGLHVRGLPGNLLAVTPDQHWTTPHGEYYLHGGHRLWTAPEDLSFMGPEENVHIAVDGDGVRLISPLDAAGLEKEISFRLDGSCVHLSQRVTWHGEKPTRLAPWSITQMRLGGMAILPQSMGDGGLGPNRQLVLWPYSRLSDPRLELHDDLILVHGRAAAEAFKIGSYSLHGWAAYAMPDVLFVKRFSVDRTGSYPDRGCSTETYVKDSCLELEALGPQATLQPGESLAFQEAWEVYTGEYPAALETARRVSMELSLKSNRMES